MTDGDSVGTTAIRKASWRLLPLLFLGFAVAYIDRLNISFAALQMNQELHFSATIYGIGSGLFFLSYSLLEVPSNLMLLHFGPRRWIARIMITWGLIAAGMMFVRTPLQFYVMRFLLGAAEAGFVNGVFYYLTLWFPASYRGRATSRFYVAVPLSAAVMAALAAPLLGLNGRLGLAGWQWLFLIQGAPAVLLAPVILFRLPDDPTKAGWLTETERAWLQSRLSAERKALGEHGEPGFARALLDRRVWLLGLCNMFILGASYTFNLSAPALLKGASHWNTAQVGLLMSATALLGAFCMLFNGAHSDGRCERYLHTLVPYCLVAGAFLAMGFSVVPGVVVLAYIVFYSCHMAGQGSFWLIPSDTLHGRSVAGGFAMVNTIGQMGSFLGPIAWGFAKDHTGSYQLGLFSVSFSFMAAVVLLLLIRRTVRSAKTSAAAAIA
jgi:MFS transporter, ACS family, tartrate transporter